MVVVDFRQPPGLDQSITTSRVPILKRSTLGPIVAFEEHEIDEDATK